jgi:hypothetical protein
MRLIFAAATAFALLLTACGSQHVRPSGASLPEKDRYVAMNLFLNTNDFVSADQANMLRYLGESLKSSGRFSRLDGGMLRWPYTLQIKYEWRKPNLAGEFALALGSAATLGIVPSPLTELHSYSFEVVHGTDVVRDFKYEETVKSSMSVFNMGKIEKDRMASMDKVLARFFEDLETSGIVPHVGDSEVERGREAQADVTTKAPTI